MIAASVLSVVALGVLAASVRDAQGAITGAAGVNAAEDAAAMPIGPARDRKLDEAQAWLTDAIAIRGPDADLLGALAETRYHQATGAEVRSVSPALISASLQAAREGAVLAPLNARTQARLAAVLSVLDGRDLEAAAALGRSYQLTALSLELAPLRVEAAGRIYDRLDARAQMEARSEACVLNRMGGALAPVFVEITQDPSCAPSPDSLPQGQ